MPPRINPEARTAVLRRSGGRCERCGHRGNRANWEMHLHHLTYERFHRELPEDLILLCLACHSAAHDGRTFHTRAEQQADRRRRASVGWRDMEARARKELANAAKRIDRRYRRA